MSAELLTQRFRRWIENSLNAEYPQSVVWRGNWKLRADSANDSQEKHREYEFISVAA